MVKLSCLLLLASLTAACGNETDNLDHANFVVVDAVLEMQTLRLTALSGAMTAAGDLRITTEDGERLVAPVTLQGGSAGSSLGVFSDLGSVMVLPEGGAPAEALFGIYVGVEADMVSFLGLGTRQASNGVVTLKSGGLILGLGLSLAVESLLLDRSSDWAEEGG